MPLKIEPSKIIDVILIKQSQYYALWAVYTAVQFTAAGFGLSTGDLATWVGVAVLAGFWAFNIGHLGFVLACQVQLDNLKAALAAADDPVAYDEAVDVAFADLHEARIFWMMTPQPSGRLLFLQNIAVHLFIDSCASVAILLRLHGVLH